jgi:lysozyme family protein
MADSEDQPFDFNKIPPEDSAREVSSNPEDLHVDPLAPPEPSLELAVRQWRGAKALFRLRDQINAAFPARSKASDGLIGDAAHATRASDHNPWVIDNGVGVVTAMDITHDPAHGCDAGALAQSLWQSRDRRIKYIIWNRKIANSQPIGAAPAWAWRSYTGANPHNHHFHLSVLAERAAYDNVDGWTIAAPAPEAVVDANVQSAALIGAGLEALPGADDRPLFERLVDAQEEVAALLSQYAADMRPARAEDAEEAAAPTFAQLKPEYENLWASCAIRQERSSAVAWYRNKLVANRPRYEEVAAESQAPWWFIGITHALEATFNFQGHLHNGDPLSRRTVNVPAGRPIQWNPPTDWVSSAIDAITVEGFAGQHDWSLARAIYRFEGFNGYAYHRKGINSPYLWSFSNQYTKGKYVRDGVYDANVVSAQCGAAVMLKALQVSGDVQL